MAWGLRGPPSNRQGERKKKPPEGLFYCFDEIPWPGLVAFAGPLKLLKDQQVRRFNLRRT
jgi:hypothetical protein